MPEHWIPDEDWRTIVEHVPLVSVDLVVEHDGGVLLGRRENEPLRGRWFFPGGTVHKNETRTNAVDRVARAELGAAVDIEECLGTFEHFYDTSDVPDVDSKHYLSTAYRCTFTDPEPILGGDDQHSELRVFDPPIDGVHEYVQQCLDRIE